MSCAAQPDSLSRFFFFFPPKNLLYPKNHFPYFSAVLSTVHASPHDHYSGSSFSVPLTTLPVCPATPPYSEYLMRRLH